MSRITGVFSGLVRAASCSAVSSSLMIPPGSRVSDVLRTSAWPEKGVRGTALVRMVEDRAVLDDVRDMDDARLLGAEVWRADPEVKVASVAAYLA